MALRDRLLIVLLRWSGLRISEALSLRRGDVLDLGQVLPEFTIGRSRTKGAKSPATVYVNDELREALAAWLMRMEALGWQTADRYLFTAMGRRNRPIHPGHAWRLLRGYARRVGVAGRICPHSLRKTFGTDIYERSHGDIRATQEALRHHSAEATRYYLPVTRNRLKRLILGEREPRPPMTDT